jgi:hypothetical protein
MEQHLDEPYELILICHLLALEECLAGADRLFKLPHSRPGRVQHYSHYMGTGLDHHGASATHMTNTCTVLGGATVYAMIVMHNCLTPKHDEGRIW